MNDFVLNTYGKLISTGVGSGITNFYAIVYLISGITAIPVIVYLVWKFLLKP